MNEFRWKWRNAPVKITSVPVYRYTIPPYSMQRSYDHLREFSGRYWRAPKYEATAMQPRQRIECQWKISNIIQSIRLELREMAHFPGSPSSVLFLLLFRNDFIISTCTDGRATQQSNRKRCGGFHLFIHFAASAVRKPTETTDVGQTADQRWNEKWKRRTKTETVTVSSGRSMIYCQQIDWAFSELTNTGEDIYSEKSLKKRQKIGFRLILPWFCCAGPSFWWLRSTFCSSHNRPSETLLLFHFTHFGCWTDAMSEWVRIFCARHERKRICSAWALWHVSHGARALINNEQKAVRPRCTDPMVCDCMLFYDIFQFCRGQCVSESGRHGKQRRQTIMKCTIIIIERSFRIGAIGVLHVSGAYPCCRLCQYQHL